MRRRGIEVVIIILDVLTVIAFGPSEAEQALLQDRIAAIPEGESKTKPLVIVTDTGDAILGPAIGARASMIMREVIPSGPIRAVIFTRISPGTFGEVGSPTSPVFLPAVRLQNAIALSVHT